MQFLQLTYFFWRAGSDRGTRLTYLRHAAGSACETPRGADTG